MNLENNLIALARIVDDAMLTDLPSWLRDRSPRLLRRRVVGHFRDAQVLTTWPTRGSPRAAVALSWLEDSPFGTPVGRIHAVASPHDDEAMDALCQLLRDLPTRADWPLLMEPHWSLRAIVPTLVELGFGIDGLSLVGDVDTACARLSYAKKPNEGPAVVRAKTADFDAILALRHSCFQLEDNDQAWYVGTPSELVRKRALLERSSSQAWIVRDSHGVGAYLTVVRNRSSPLVERIASIDIAVRADLRGQGCLRALLTRALPAMRAQGLRYYAGVTARPQVLRMAQSLGRVPVRIMMRTAAPHLPQHFDSTYPFAVGTVTNDASTDAAVRRR